MWCVHVHTSHAWEVGLGCYLGSTFLAEMMDLQAGVVWVCMGVGKGRHHGLAVDTPVLLPTMMLKVLGR